MQQDDGTMQKLSSEELTSDFVKKNVQLVFMEGEQVKVKGGDFRIKSIGKKFMVLESLPGTRLR